MKIITTLLWLLLAAGASHAQTYCCDQAAEDAYRADLAALNAAVTTESFEGAAWDASYWTTITNPDSVLSVTDQGLTWYRDGSGIQTSACGGWVAEGVRCMYAKDFRVPGVYYTGHPQPDGFSIDSDTTMIGVGGWFYGNRAEVAILVGGVIQVSSVQSTTGWRFLGYIDAAGFDTVDIRQIDTDNLIFAADNFSIGTGAAATQPCVPEPVTPRRKKREQKTCVWNAEDNKFDCED